MWIFLCFCFWRSQNGAEGEKKNTSKEAFVRRYVDLRENFSVKFAQ